MGKLFLLTGEIHSGKTTELMKWSLNKKNIDGIFQPVIDGKRFIYHIASRILLPLETDEEENITKIGRYKFSNQTFEWARNILLNSINRDLEWIVIDEIGPLELTGKALEPAVSNIFSKRKNFSAKLICAVRNSMLEEFVEHYQIENDYELLSLNNLNDEKSMQ